MTDDQLKELYKEAEERSEEGQQWLKQFAEKHNDWSYDWKNPYWYISYHCREILGKRAVE